MGVRHCTFPWHWMLIANDGSVHPCPHGSQAVGNVADGPVEEAWNSALMQEVRASILNGRVHRVCRSPACPHQRPNDAFSPLDAIPYLDRELADSFDEAWYLENNPDIKAAVERLQLVSGLEHFARFGREEGRPYRLRSERTGGEAAERIGEDRTPQAGNALLALREYTRGATSLASLPVDVVLQISTVCNLRCVMCGQGVGGVPKPRHMPVEVVERSAPCLTAAARMIISGLGEPLIAPAFWKVLAEHAREPTVFIRANSNGYFMTEERAGLVLESGLKEISFSLDAATPETYARIRGGVLETALKGVTIMVEARRRRPRKSLEIFINMTLMIENIAEAPAFVELAHRLQVDAVIFGQLVADGDQPTWVVRREGWTFTYSEQMLRNAPELGRRHLMEAKARADALGLKLIFLQNTHLFLASDVHPGELPAQCSSTAPRT